MCHGLVFFFTSFVDPIITDVGLDFCFCLSRLTWFAAYNLC